MATQMEARDDRASQYPALWRAMAGDEADRLMYDQPIALLSTQLGTVERAVVVSANDASVLVALRSGARISLDVDDPAYWPDDEQRDRRAPTSEDGEWVAIVTGETDNTDLTVAIRASLEVSKLHRRADALLADVTAMQHQLRVLGVRKAS